MSPRAPADGPLVRRSSAASLLRPEDICEPEWADWYRMTPEERWVESGRLWMTYLTLGGTLDPEPDTDSPFGDTGAWSAKPPDGRPGVHLVRRSGV